MKKFIVVIFCLVSFTRLSFAQSSGNVTINVIDSTGIVWPYAQVTYNLYNPQGGQPVNTVTGFPVQTKNTYRADASGTVTGNLDRNDKIIPFGTSWIPTVCLYNAEKVNSFSGDNQCQTLQPIFVTSSNPSFPGLIQGQLQPYTIAPGLEIPISHNGATGQPFNYGNFYWDMLQQKLFLNDPINGYTVAGGSNTSPAQQNITSGYWLDYQYTEQTGTVVKDLSGNSHDANFCTVNCTAPTWANGGLTFGSSAGVNKTAGLILPGSTVGTQSYLFVMYSPPIGKALFPVNFSTILVGVNAGSFNLLTGYTNPANQFEGGYSITTYVSSPTNNTPVTYVGLHAVGFVCGSGSGTVDHMYLDGIEVPNLKTAATSCATMVSSAQFGIGQTGNAPWISQGGLLGTMYRTLGWPTKLTSAQMYSSSLAALASVTTRGVATMPSLPQPTGVITFLPDGDSITAGLGVATPWPSLLSITNAPWTAVNNWGVNTMSARQASMAEPERVALQCKSGNGANNYAVWFLGTNDFLSAAATFQNGKTVSQYSQQGMTALKRAGCRVYVASMLSRTGSGTNSQTMDANKNDLDSVIASQWKNWGIDGYLDFASDVRFGKDGAYANPLPTACGGSGCFQGDGVHPSQNGHAALAALASTYFNYQFSPYSSSFPHTIATTTYTMASQDVAIIRSGSAGNGDTITLPDCTALTSLPFTITNTGAGSITVSGNSGSQTINGSLTMVLPVGGSVRVIAAVPTYATSGCSWLLN